MRFIVEVRIEGADRTKPSPSPVTVGVIERCADSNPASGLGLLLQETKDLMQERPVRWRRFKVPGVHGDVGHQRHAANRLPNGSARPDWPALVCIHAAPHAERWPTAGSLSARSPKRSPSVHIRSGHGCGVDAPA
jgi:hypothetical protein